MDANDESPPCLVYRHEVRRTSDRLGRHIRGETRHAITSANPPMPDPATGKPLGVELLAPTMDAATAAALRKERNAALAGKAGRRPLPYAELLFTAARRVGEHAWTPDQARQWASAIPDWIAKTYPDSPIMDCALHMDESQFHVHALIFPRGRARDGALGYGMTAASRAADAAIRGAPVPRRLGYEEKKAAATRLQDNAWEALGKPFGLGRGEKGSARRAKALSDAERGKRMVEEAEERAAERDAQSQANLKETQRLLDEQRGLTPAFRRRAVARDEAKAKAKVAAANELMAEAKAKMEEGNERMAKGASSELLARKAWAAVEAARRNVVDIAREWRERMGPRSAAWRRVEDALERGGLVAEPVERPRSAVDELREHSRAHRRELRSQANAGRTGKGRER